MKIAYFGYPHVGGTFSVFRHLRSGLEPLGTEVCWAGLGEEARAVAADPAWETEHATGFAVAARGCSAREGTAAFVGEIERRGFDGVFVNVLADRIQTNAVRYLRDDVMRVMIVHNITPGTYAAARAVRDNVHATVAVSRRIEDDLVCRYGFDPARTTTIPNATSAAPHMRMYERVAGRPLRLLFVGRIEDQSKGVFWLADILRQVPDATLTVVGSGPDEAALHRMLQPFAKRVVFLGALSADSVQAMYADHDVLLAPSRYEGFLIVLVEAMSKGCIPVASHIHGVTDMIVETGSNGYLFPVGDTTAAARSIAALLDPAVFNRISSRAIETVARKFSVPDMARRYQDLLERIAANPPQIAPVQDLSNWRMQPGLRTGLRTYLPLPVKNFLRTYRERVAL